MVAALFCATTAHGDPPEEPLRELIGYTTDTTKGLGFKKMNNKCSTQFGAGVRICNRKQLRQTVTPPALTAGDLAWVQGEPKVSKSDISVTSKEAAFKRGLGGSKPARCRDWNGGGWSGVIYLHTGIFSVQPCWKQARVACCALKQ